MNVPPALRSLAAAAFLCLSASSLAAIQLTQVTSGLSTPIFAGNAGDGSNRLFIVEQPGVIRVLQAGASTPTVFLDIQARVLFGGERGLLGLAFHPQYATNGRFFVYYSRVDDGTLVIAEYHVSGNPNVANAAESVLLTIPHPINQNHNGGMLAFGGDGYLYMGVGDGGSGNDPPNNAQNVNVLLGKILRIDVDHPDTAAGTLYSAPADNPYVGLAGRREIYSIGWRNPWRFSFDRVTHQQWVGDAGQDALEEVDTPILKGGNYGWRVYEGLSCTNNDPTLCNPANYLFPIFDYAHTGGRCVITGGYVYRGTRSTLPPGTYLYADYCTGEIFAWDGTAQSVLLATGLNISSFGEDEQGELYVVDIGGTISKLVSTAASSLATAIEYYHQAFDHYFVTTLANEIAALDSGMTAGWARTGLAFNVYVSGVPGTAAVCRFFSTAFGAKSSHFYTPNAPECAIVMTNPNWQFEGQVFNVTLPTGTSGACPPGAQPLYRMYNNGQGGAPNHRYTTDLSVRALMLTLGWIPEGDGIGVIACVPT